MVNIWLLCATFCSQPIRSLHFWSCDPSQKMQPVASGGIQSWNFANWSIFGCSVPLFALNQSEASIFGHVTQAKKYSQWPEGAPKVEILQIGQYLAVLCHFLLSTNQRPPFCHMTSFLSSDCAQKSDKICRTISTFDFHVASECSIGAHIEACNFGLG